MNTVQTNSFWIPACAGMTVTMLAASGLTLPGVRGKLTSEGPEIGGNSPQELTTFLERGIARWAQVIKDSGVKL